MSDNQIDSYDRLLGALHSLPDITNTQPSTIRTIDPLIGATQTFIVQTYHQREQGDTIFLEVVSRDGMVRWAIPPDVSDVIARQREALTDADKMMEARGGTPPSLDHTAAVDAIQKFAEALDARIAAKTLSTQFDPAQLPQAISDLYLAITGKDPEPGMLEAILERLP